MDQHFQGVDDGIGGKILPTLPSGYAGSVVDRSLMNASHFSPANSGDTGSFSKIAIADARPTQVASFASPTSTLVTSWAASPPSPEGVVAGALLYVSESS